MNDYPELDGKDLAALGSRAEFLDARKATLEAELAEVNKELEHLKVSRIPKALEQAGLKSCRLSSGRGITVVDEFYADVKAEAREEFFEWLRDNACGDLIKETVNPQTLRAWAKDRIQNMQELPDVVNLRTVPKARFTK